METSIYSVGNDRSPTRICTETIFHLIMKSTLAKLCGVGIVYLFFLLTEMKCHDSWRNVCFIPGITTFKKDEDNEIRN
jgi:hypothetical protein